LEVTVRQKAIPSARMARASVTLALITLILTAAIAARAEELPIVAGWTEAERWAWGEIRAGRVADFNARYGETLDPAKPTGWDSAALGKDRRLSPWFLATILLNAPLKQFIPGQGIVISGAWFPQGLELGYISLEGPLIFRHSRFERTLRVTSVRIRDFFLQGVTANSDVDFISAEIGGTLLVEGGTFTGPVNMTNLTVGSHLGIWNGALPTEDNLQECAVLSRLIYGLSAAYLIVGDERYRKAAEAAVRFQREAFRSLSHNSQYCFWAFGRRRGRYGTELLVPSESGDDNGSIPLYEQIYALAGLANYYRISLDWEVLEDIRRTVRAFNEFFLDEEREGDPAFRGEGGYFSHIDYSTMRPERNANEANDLKKNWNSFGDHIPAYLVNLLLALDPLPLGSREDLEEFLDIAREMLERMTTLIIEKFPDKNPTIPYVNERFLANWEPDHVYSWQQNRAVVGHNFKIAWNLTRVSNYYNSLARDLAHHQPSSGVRKDAPSRAKHERHRRKLLPLLQTGLP
jgi:hypothetical protein